MSNHGTSMNKQINPTNAIYIMFIIYIIIFILIMILINNKKLGCSHHNITLVSFKGVNIFSVWIGSWLYKIYLPVFQSHLS